jgi:hypothetical protein
MKRLRDMTELRGNEPAQPMGVSGILRKKGWRVTNVKNHHSSTCAILRHIGHIPAIWLQERNAAGHFRRLSVPGRRNGCLPPAR